MERLETRLRQYAPLWGHWTPAARIYRSGSCCVYTLSDERSEQGFPCVVKVITVLGQGQELEQRAAEVRQEIEALERLRDCETVVTLYDQAWMPLRENGALVGWDVLMRMEHLECVAELLREGESLPVEAVRTLANDIASALSAAHQAGLIHRDVKPANLYRTPFGRFQLGDFGIARRCRTGILETMTGTAAYMAPEVARGEVYDSRADLYSLGVVLYQLLNNGQLPLTEDDTPFAQREEAVRRRWQGTKLPAPPNGDRRLKKIVLRCCESRPQSRFSSAEALLQRLNRPKTTGWRTVAAAGWACALALSVLTATGLLRLGPALPPPGEPEETPELVDVGPGEERRYAVIKASMTWEKARVYCEARGGHLATISNQEQMDTITALLEENEIDTVWLGANNYSSSNGFQWITGEPFDYAVWAIGEPNNDGGNEHYLMMYQREGQGWVWNDSVVDGMRLFKTKTCGFVCQWDETDGS